MKKFKNIYLLILVFMGIVSCELPDNVDPKGASKVPAEALFSNAEVGWVGCINSINVNRNISRLLAQYNAQIIYVDEGNFNFIDRRIPDTYFQRFYLNVLMDMKEAKKILNEVEITVPGLVQERKNKLGIIDIIEVYAYQCLVDAFGNVPYTEALQGLDNPSPAYDDAQTIYVDLLARLNNDLATMSDAQGSFGSNDFLFGGDVSLWITFANSLKLRLAMRMADVTSLAASAQAAAEQAIAAGVISTHGQSAVYVYPGVTPYTNSIYEEMVEGGRNDFVPANAIIDYMVSVNDPRLPLYATTVDTSTEEGVVKPAYIGGNPGDQNNSWASCSHFSDAMFEATFPVTIIGLAEVEFLLAEAAARNFAGAGDAAEHYANAITASVEAWGGDAADVAAYIAQPAVAYNAADWKTSIGVQKWVALYNQGVEAWAEIRRLNIDVWETGPLVRPAEALLSNNPKRLPYPYVEDDVNRTNKDAAGVAIGGDDPMTRIFWDVE
jgi:hypothetical protein